MKRIVCANRMYLKELEDEKVAERKRDEATFGRFRSMQMNDYVSNARNTLHASRAKAKRDVMIARLKAQEEIKREIREAKAKAIQDLIAEEDAKKGLLERVMMQIGMMKEEGAEGNEHRDEDEDGEHDEGGDAGAGGGGGGGDVPAIEGYGGDQGALTEGGGGGDGDGGNELALAGGTLVSEKG
jgi:hypothetical protein